MKTKKSAPNETDSIGYVALAQLLRQQIISGKVEAGEVLPTVRALGAQHGVSHETVRRAFAVLERERLVASEGRRGCRVQAKTKHPDQGLPVAYVVSSPQELSKLDSLSHQLLNSLQQAAAERNWSVLTMGGKGRTLAEVRQQLQDCRVSAMVLDYPNPSYLNIAKAIGLPVVVIGYWAPDMGVDAVVQDSFQGAMQATQFLLDRGHRRLGWLGNITDGVISRERFGGFAAAAAGAGRLPVAECMGDTAWDDIAVGARRLLSRPDRPTGVLGLWFAAAQQLTLAARELGLQPGKDLEIVGWSEAGEFDRSYRWLFPENQMPPTMIWSSLELAQLTLNRLAERRRQPDVPAALIKLPARLRLPDNMASTWTPPTPAAV